MCILDVCMYFVCATYSSISLVPRFSSARTKNQSDGKLGGAWERGYSSIELSFLPAKMSFLMSE